jgi:ATP-dependent DNA helicase RecG
LPAELIERAAQIFRAEAQDGYRDRVVIGGLAGFAARLAVGDVADLLRDYASMQPSERAARLEAAQALLTGGSPRPLGEVARSAGEGGAAARTPPPIRTPHPPPSPSGRGSPAAPVGVSLETRMEALKGVGPMRARYYSRLGIHTIRDLLFHFPLRHQRFQPAAPIAQLFFQAEGSVVGVLERLEVDNLPRGLKKLRATVKDESGTVTAVWLRHGIARIGVNAGERIALSGPLVLQGRQLIFENPDYERAEGEPIHTRRLVPVHPLTAGLSERELRGRVWWALTHFANGLADPLPEDVRTQLGLLPISEAVWRMHFPDTLEQYAQARRRFAFQELLSIQLMVLKRRMTWQHDPAAAMPRNVAALEGLERGLPFELTGAQRRVIDEILVDMAEPRPMTRLLQGEVGSGKTAVAAMTLLNAVANGHQGALMAPTEILAEQHFGTLSRLMSAAAAPLREAMGRDPVLRLLTGSVKGRERNAAYREVADGSVDVLVGTQALIQERLEFASLGVVIVDEQHRFGVRQRVTLRHRAVDAVPHLLVMTATPIPRTLALSLYGDLDLSTIDEMPPGRVAPRTLLLSGDDRPFAYEKVRRAAAKGEQIFVICPLVEESEVLEAKSATEEYERLRTGELSTLRLALLHGRMRAADKDAIMRAFRDHEYDVLVSTAVVEVGVDVPNATVMLIEGAERFGLAQLHQFRGRVGRGGQPSVCILLTELPDPQVSERLQAVVENTNGLALADQDLRLRGPGDFFGVRQSGAPELKVARLDDAPLVEAARSAASSILSADADLAAPEHAALAAHLAEFIEHSGDPS